LYFNRLEFSSFARQLNFYGFRKIQTKPLRNDDFDKTTAKYVTFHNENFKRGRPDLLLRIQRSTRGGADKATIADQGREVELLTAKVFMLEDKIRDLEATLERSILAKAEALVMNIMGSSQTLRNLSVGGLGSMGLLGAQALPLNTASASSIVGTGASAGASGSAGGQPTLPPHPKEKMLPASLERNLSVGNLTNSSLLLRNAWEDKFLSSVMLQGGGLGGGFPGGFHGGNVGGLAALAAAQQMQCQQQQMEFAAILQRNLQQGGTGVGEGGPEGGGGSDGDGNTNTSKNQMDSELQRQTTAEILLEAAGELGTDANMPSFDKTGGQKQENTAASFLAADVTKHEEV